MDPRERLFAVANGMKTDRPPCICPGGMMNMMFEEIMDASGCPWPEAHSDAKLMAGLADALYQAGGFENYGVPFCMTVEAEALGARVDMGNKLCEPHVVDSPLTDCAQWKELPALDIDACRIPVVREAISILKVKDSGVPVIGNICGPISLAGTLVHMAVLLKAMRKTPEVAHAMLEYVSDQLIVYGKALLDAGADAICISEPSGTGELLGPKHFAAYTVPYVNKVLEALPAKVKIVHICGRLNSVFEALEQLHCHIFSFDSIVSVKEIAPHLGGKAVMGNISTAALGTMTPEHIERLTRHAMESGVDVVAPACGLPTTTPLKNVCALVDTVRKAVNK